MKKTFYQHSVWCINNNEWIVSDEATFNDEIVDHRSLYDLRCVFEDNKTIYYFDSKISSALDWKVVVER